MNCPRTPAPLRAESWKVMEEFDAGTFDPFHFKL